jgi:acyl-coenzyme A thioesterase PaaI-like protein
MPRSLLERLLPGRLLNLWPCYYGTGVRLKHVAKDFREFRLEVPLNWRTRNYVGTIFGGSMYGAVDPVYMLMLIKNLGPSYEVWDKAATIRFKKPGRSTLHAEIKLDQEEIDQIRNELSHTESLDRVYNIDLTDEKGTTCATVEKVIHIRKKEWTDKARDRVRLDKEPNLGENLRTSV